MRAFFPAWPGKQSRVISPNSIGGFTPFTPHSGLQEIPVATRQENGVLFFPSRRGLTLQVSRECNPEIPVGPGKSNLPFELQVRAGDCSRVTAGQIRAHLGLCPGPSFSLQGRQGSWGCIPDSPGESGLVSKGMNGLRSPLESRRVSLGAQEWPKWS